MGRPACFPERDRIEWQAGDSKEVQARMEVLSYFTAAEPEVWARRIGESDWRAGRYLSALLEEGRFREEYGDTSDILLLAEGDRLAAFCTLAERDEIPDTELAPWIGFVYTFPEYRGRRLMGTLIGKARELAREAGKDTLYISTEETGLYEKYGAEFMAGMKTRSGEDTRVYRLDAYGFSGWEAADVPALDGKYPGIRTPKDLYNALWHVWSAETCAPRMRSGWNEGNRTLGQCSVTAFLCQDIFGGKVYGVPLEDGSFHCYNAVGDRVFDLTSEQFARRLDYKNNPEQFRETHFRKEEKRARYESLGKALQAYLQARS